jgi:hypothetical protein
MPFTLETNLRTRRRLTTIIETWLGRKARAVMPDDEHPAISPPVEQPSSQPTTKGSEAVAVGIDNATNEEFTRPIRRASNPDFHADIDLIDKCNLQCPTCFRGTAAQKNTSSTMPLSRFREIVNKLREEGFPNVALTNWTEPFLCKTLHEYVPVVKEAGLDCWLSSNLSLPPKNYLSTIIAALASGVDILFVSVSGFTQSVYEINHKGGRVDWIKSNLEGISQQLRTGKIKTGVWIRYLEFPYNSHEKAPWEDYAKRLGIGFDPVLAHGDPNKPLPSAEGFRQYVRDPLKSVDELDKTDIAEIIRDYGESIRLDPLCSHDHSISRLSSAKRPELSDLSHNLPDTICSLIADRVAIDAKGDAYLCCAYPNAGELRIGSYLELSESELLLRRYTHPFCARCALPRRSATNADHDRLIRAWQERRESAPSS